MRIYLNGKFVRQEEARLSVLDPGFLYGQGLFETMRAYNGEVFRLDSHIQRLLNSLAIIGIDALIEPDSLKEAAKRCLKENDLKDAYVRLTLWQGEDNKVKVMAMAKPYRFPGKEEYQKGFKAMLSSFRQNESSLLCRVKSANYLHLLLAYQEARKNNFDEALFLNTKGFLAEASRGNIFLVKDNCLLTPELDCGCLPGITRDTVLALAAREKIKAIEARLTLEDLERAQEAFLTNSLIEVMPLVSLDAKPVNNGRPGEITQRILKRYRSAMNA